MGIESAGFEGALISLSLIVAIGAQNAFVIRQGLSDRHVFLVCTICAFSDAALISLGVFGFGEIISNSESLSEHFMNSPFSKFISLRSLSLYFYGNSSTAI